MSVTRLMEATTSFMVPPAGSTMALPGGGDAERVFAHVAHDVNKAVPQFLDGMQPAAGVALPDADGRVEMALCHPLGDGFGFCRLCAQTADDAAETQHAGGNQDFRTRLPRSVAPLTQGAATGSPGIDGHQPKAGIHKKYRWIMQAERACMGVADIHRELDKARDEGPVKDIVIPPCPELLLELRKEVDQADPDPAEITRIAASDVAMAASLMRIANSPLYARPRPAETVAQAVAMLGVGPTIGILTCFLTRNSIPVKSQLIEHFWETSTRRALAMGFIAKQLYGVDAEIAHTCGLFCHVGIPIMLMGLKGYSGTLAEAMARQDRGFTETENAAHHTDHAVVGAIVAKTWRLSPLVAVAVRLHHDFTALNDTRFPDEVRTLVAMGLVAENLVARHEGIQVHREWDQYGQACMDHIRISPEEVDAWVDALYPVFESVSVI